MASLISGYEYDIFISYRQKDNKHDGWVTEFVNNLKGELESTFKEDISIYFDENPHDGLLETHSVDKSLEDKLRCLIFIPIISQTYCDPKSFAWQHEFCAFNKLAKEDKFGRDIKLTSGNVASRILPVKIHDIDPEDKALLENELGVVLRSVEFIYKSAGVNRPLTANEDHPQDNLNKTYYRDQINKVANAVKEIITALNKQSQHPEEAVKENLKAKSGNKKNLRTKLIIGSVTALVLIILGVLFIPELLKPMRELEKTIAVLPFRNLTNDSTQLYFCEGFMEEILNNLQKINSFTVRSRTSSDLYRDTKKPITVIGNELNANYLIEGSVGREENRIKIWVQLIDAKADKHIWSNDYTRELKQVLSLQSEIAKDIASELKTVLSPEEKGLIEKSQTDNLEAYDLCLQGRHFWNMRGEENLNKAMAYFEKALAIDTNYAIAYAGLADYYFTRVVNYYHLPASEGFPRAEKLALKAIELDKNIAEPHVTLGGVFYNEMKWEEARKEFLRAIEINPNYAEAYYAYAQLLDVLRQNIEARIQMDKAIKLSPFQLNYHGWSGTLYYNEGKFDKYFNESQINIELTVNPKPDYIGYFSVYFWMGEYSKAFEAVQKYFESSSDTLAPKYVKITKEIYDSSGIDGILKWEIERIPKDYYHNARWYVMLGKKDQALDCLEKVSENPPIQFFRINNDYDFSSLHSEPRFQAIIKKMGLSDYQVPN
jgi:TolB-like protein/Tfp pilus assembly protein PilF